MRTFQAGLHLHCLSGDHAAMDCQARRAVKLDGGAQLASSQRRNHHHHWRARVVPRRLQEAAHAVAALLVGRCRQGRHAGEWVPCSGERCSEAASVCGAEAVCAGLRVQAAAAAHHTTRCAQPAAPPAMTPHTNPQQDRTRTRAVRLQGGHKRCPPPRLPVPVLRLLLPQRVRLLPQERLHLHHSATATAGMRYASCRVHSRQNPRR